MARQKKAVHVSPDVKCFLHLKGSRADVDDVADGARLWQALQGRREFWRARVSIVFSGLT